MNDLIKTGKQVFTFAVVLSTIAWSVGLGALALPLAANAVTLASGDLIKGSGTAVYYYGNDEKRYVFPYAASYNSWYTGFGTVKTLSDAELIAIPFGGNVTARPARLAQVVSMDTPWTVMDSKVYAVEKGGVLRWVKTAATASAIFGATWESQIVAIPESLLTNYTIGSEINAAGDYTLATQQAVASVNEDKGLVGGGTGVAGTLAIALASDTPAAASVPKSAADVSFTKVNLTAGSSDVNVTGLKVTRTGLGIDSNLSSVKLYVDGVQRGTSQSLGSTHIATFTLSSNPIVVPANSTVAVVLGANIAAATAYDQHILGIANATDVTTTATVTGSFPVNGNVMSLANVTIGTATLYNGALHPSADTGTDPDDEDYRFTQLKITAGSTEGLIVSQITAVKNGTAANTDVKNIELYNDTTGATIATVAALNGDGRAVFKDLNITLAKGASVELSVRADMNGGSGRTIAFDLHDGTSYTIMVKGATYNVGITPSRNNFCAAAGTCQTQTINQGYLTVSKSASTPATGKVAIGGTQVPLAAFDFTAAGENINVTSSQLSLVTGAALMASEITNVTLYDSTGAILAGPQDGTTAVDGTDQTLTFTDAFTVPMGTNVFTVKADISSSAGDTTTDTIAISVPVNTITAKGANSGKTTYTTSSGSTVPPATAATGNVQTCQGPFLAIVTPAAPAAGNVVLNAQDYIFAYFDLDATSGGEDVRVSSVTVTSTSGSESFTDVTNLELWGDPDNTDATVQNIRLETSNSTTTMTDGGATGTQLFTFKTPVVVSKTAVSRLTLKTDVLSANNDTSHTFKVNAVGDVVATGKSSGTTLAAGSKSVSGAGQLQTIQSVGTLKIEKAGDMPAGVQIASSTTGIEVMKYKLTAAYEDIDITELPLYYVATNAAGNAAVSKVYLYKDGALLGSTTGYAFNASYLATVTLPAGTLIIPKDSSIYLSIKVDTTEKASITTATTARTFGLGDSDSDNSTWGGAGSYNITATGRSSGTTLTETNIDSIGDGNGNVYGSNSFYIFKGVLTVSLNASTPSGTQTAGAGSEALRFNLTATGDDLTVSEIEFCVNGTATAVTGTGDVTLKSEDLGTTYATLTQAIYDGTWDDLGGNGVNAGTYYQMDPGVTGQSCFSMGVTGETGVTVADQASESITDTTVAFTNTITIGAGTTKVVRLFGDTTGAASTKTLQVSIGPNSTSANAATTSGLSYADTSGTEVDTVTVITKGLPLTGGSLSY